MKTFVKGLPVRTASELKSAMKDHRVFFMVDEIVDWQAMENRSAWEVLSNLCNGLISYAEEKDPASEIPCPCCETRNATSKEKNKGTGWLYCKLCGCEWMQQKRSTHAVALPDSVVAELSKLKQAKDRLDEAIRERDELNIRLDSLRKAYDSLMDGSQKLKVTVDCQIDTISKLESKLRAQSDRLMAQSDCIKQRDDLLSKQSTRITVLEQKEARVLEALRATDRWNHRDCSNTIEFCMSIVKEQL